MLHYCYTINHHTNPVKSPKVTRQIDIPKHPQNGF